MRSELCLINDIISRLNNIYIVVEKKNVSYRKRTIFCFNFHFFFFFFFFFFLMTVLFLFFFFVFFFVFFFFCFNYFSAKYWKRNE